MQGRPRRATRPPFSRTGPKGAAAREPCLRVAPRTHLSLHQTRTGGEHRSPFPLPGPWAAAAPAQAPALWLCGVTASARPWRGSAAPAAYELAKSRPRNALIIGTLFDDYRRTPESVPHPSTEFNVNWGRPARRATSSFPKSTFSTKPGLLKKYFRKKPPPLAQVSAGTPPPLC